MKRELISLNRQLKVLLDARIVLSNNSLCTKSINDNMDILRSRRNELQLKIHLSLV